MKCFYSEKTQLGIWALCFTLLLSTFSLQGYAQAKRTKSAKVYAQPGVLVIKLKPEYRYNATRNSLAIAQLAKPFSKLGVQQVAQKFPEVKAPATFTEGAVDLSLVYELNYTAGIAPAEAAKLITATGAVEYAEPLNYYPTMYEPNDPYADSVSGKQYHLRKIRAYEAWNIEKGDTNVVVGIIDSGTKLDHPDLQGNLKINYADPVNGIDDDNDGLIDNYKGWDFSNNDNDVTTPTNLGHGVNVTGVVSATTNNGTGLAGTGFNCKYVPLKVYPSGAGTGVFRGYEAIVYAALNGIKIVNLSWGGDAPPSAFEQDVINFAAINHDVLIVSSSGNTNEELDFYPASYDNVLSVTGTDSFKIKGNSFTYSNKIDICAPAVEIWTAVRNSSLYTKLGGTSFATPQVTGCAALIRSNRPHLTAQQVAEQIRVSADASIYSLGGNTNYIEKMGYGFLDMYKALADTTTPSVRNLRHSLSGQQPVYTGDNITLTGDFRNFLAPAQNVTVTLTCTSPFIDITDGSAVLGDMATLQTVNNTTDPFAFTVRANAPANEVVRFRMGFSAGSYTDYQYFDIVLNPDYMTLDVNKLDVTLSARGTVGYNGRFTNQGIGVSYNGGPSLISEAGLMVATDSSTVSDVVRSEPGKTHQHFFRLQPMTQQPSVFADQFITGLMQDTLADPNRVGVKVQVNGYALRNAPNDNFVITEYKLINQRSDTLRNLHAGLFADWDIFMYSRNAADYDAALKMGYVYSYEPNQPYGGLVLLSGQVPSYHAIDNFAGSGTVVVGDSFTLAEKYYTLSAGISRAQTGVNGQGTDVSHVLGATIGKLAPNDTATVAFAIVAGNSLAELQQSAAAAQALYPLQPLATATDLESLTKLSVYPNPAQNELTISFSGPQTHAQKLLLLNAVGVQVGTYTIYPGKTEIIQTNHLPSGLYLLRSANNDSAVGRKVIIQH